jgi:ADP-dependent NAD(P)H-hydrate dehydratase / NAD(P)H-hydrate epimerase
VASIITRMESLPALVYAAAQVRAMDRHAIDVAGIQGYALMQRAAEAALSLLRRQWPDANRVTVLCGSGNNAGDGYVLARLARDLGLSVNACAIVDPLRLAGDAARAYADFVGTGGRECGFTNASLAATDVVVDALLGTGLDRPVDGAMRECIEAVNASQVPVLALDLPSGLDADTGLAQGSAISATRTITFVALKAGLFLGDARDCVGELSFDGLGIPEVSRATQQPVMERMDGKLLEAALPRRRRTAHKGDYGRVLIVGGFAMPGAARLAGEAALRAGAGLVTVATEVQGIPSIISGRPELICHAVKSAAELERLLDAADVVAIGPGLGLGRSAREVFGTVAGSGTALVVDADALTLLAEKPQQRDDWILTPHPGEAARLLGTNAAVIQRDRLGSARAIAARYGGVCVLKGAGTLVVGGDSLPLVCDFGNPGMATAGAGDVLTGIVAALVAGGCDLARAASAGVLLHARAGDRAAQAGERGLVASDLIAQLQTVVNPPWN